MLYSIRPEYNPLSSPAVRAVPDHGIVRPRRHLLIARDHFVNSLLPFEFDRPAYLWLAAALPFFWWWGRRALTGLGRVRGVVAAGLRTAVWLLIVAACAEMQWVRTDDRLSVMFLLDRSLSVPEPQRRAIIDYVNRASTARPNDDAVGAIAFGREAQVEFPPNREDLRLPPSLETVVDPQYSNLAEALRLAEASFPADAAKRIVLLSDGNQNLGNVYEAARQATDRGIGLDVVPITYRVPSDIRVEKVTLPAVARRGEPFDVQVLLDHPIEADAADGVKPDATLARRAVPGTLELLRRRGEETTVLSREHIELPVGKRPFTLRQTLNEPDFYVYEARFTPDDPRADAQVQNNRAVNFTQLEGSGRVLLIENADQPGRHEPLIAALRKLKLTVTVMPSNRLFATPEELIPYDVVVLADVPRSGSDGLNDVTSFTDQQIRLLTSNVREMGCGLVVLGGPNSLGAGGWAGTPLEEALPVDLQIRNVEVVPNGALLLVLDRSGSMSGEKLEMCKTAAIAAIKVLGPRDYAGVVAFDTTADWIVPMHRLRSTSDVVARMRRLGSGGGTDMRVAFEEGYRELRKIPAGVKHAIILTDGHTAGEGYSETAAEMRKLGITTSCVALGSDSATNLLDGIAKAGGGKFYSVAHPRMIPRIFVNEARRAARPLIYEDPQGFVPQLGANHEVLRAVTPPAGPLTGFVMSSVKASSLVQVLLDHPTFRREGSGTIAAVWTYGLGRTAVWTSDAGQAWAAGWRDRPDFEPLLTGLVRWTMRPPTGGDRFAVHADANEGQGRLIVTAIDERGDFVNLLDPQGTVIGPDRTPRPIRLEQTAPGRYAATFETTDVGSYFLVVRPGPGQPLLRTGVNVSYSAEFRDRTANESLLTSLAALHPPDGPSGLSTPLPPVVSTTSGNAISTAAPPTVDFFRHDLPHATGRRDLWPELVLASTVVFVGDVFVRRVAFAWSWLIAPFTALSARWRRNRGRIVTPQYIDRLRSRKDEIAKQVNERRTALDAPARAADSTSPSYIVDAAAPQSAETQPSETIPSAPPTAISKAADASPAESLDYTARLLAAKRKISSPRRNSDPPPTPDQSTP